MITIEDIIKNEDLFKDKYTTHELLDGGYVNKAYKVTCDNKTYCIRINNIKHSQFFQLDTTKEAQACQQASLFSIAPTAHNLNNSTEYLITDFYTGRTLSNDDSHNPEIVKKYVNAIKTIHNNVKVNRTFSIYDLIDKYIDGAKVCNVKLPDGLIKVLNQVDRIRMIRSDSKVLNNVFCHNDIWQNNILYNGDTICIIDWEFCGYGDGFFDFAHILNISNATFDEEKFLLTTYFGYFDMELWNTLQQLKYMGKVCDAAWFLFHAGITENETIKEKYLQSGSQCINNLIKRMVNENH